METLLQMAVLQLDSASVLELSSFTEMLYQVLLSNKNDSGWDGRMKNGEKKIIISNEEWRFWRMYRICRWYSYIIVAEASDQWGDLLRKKKDIFDQCTGHRWCWLRTDKNHWYTSWLPRKCDRCQCIRTNECCQTSYGLFWSRTILDWWYTLWSYSLHDERIQCKCCFARCSFLPQWY